MYYSDITMLLTVLYVCFQLYIETTHEAEINETSLEVWAKYDGQTQMFRDIVLYNCSVSELDHQTCFCKVTNNECIACCNSHCCSCQDCWNNEWQLATMTQVSISILFLLGIIGLIIVFLKTCNRPVPMHRRSDDNTSFNPVQRLAVERLRDRPPAYNEIYGAPPLYTAPQNRVSMLDAPPVYPGPPQSPERTGQASISSLPVAQHV